MPLPCRSVWSRVVHHGSAWESWERVCSPNGLLPRLALQDKCEGAIGPSFLPPVETGWRWSAVALMGWPAGSSLSMSSPQWMQ